ncbi:glycoside hydrolase family 32 protein [Echinicola sp. 20G]|uniref:glycoside hydrolase family 32 protein n=1 Tax=Echinicola sp. 20G TaxID=2781961 RepID=UPI001910B136|nr:glycoside hydrolase family 32 protein [Echinicola sp. 20G]
MKPTIKPITILLLVFFLYACSEKPKEKTEENIQLFDEKYRPQYHFSPPQQWMNDPNGMVYLDGEYHLFYQHYPDSNVWGPMHWGHAVSKDMLNWEHLPIALYPDSLGYIFSGSAVIDHGKTSGLGKDGNDPMVAIFTYHQNQKGQTQGIAFSNDKGRSWTKYNGNPVLKSPGIPDFRDPKVSWYEQTNGEGKWIMTLAVKDKISFYSSPNLIDWKHESDFNPDWAAYGGVWECPDLFPLTTPDGNEKWVLLVSINPGGPNGGSATQYFIGQFDGQTFTAEGSDVKWIDYGADNYAGVTWSNIPQEDGRRLFLGWMSNWQYANVVPTQVWRSAMTIPRELQLVKDNSGNILLSSTPVKEIQNLVESTNVVEGASFTLDHNLFQLDLGKTPEQPGSVILSNDLGESITLQISNDAITFDRSNAGHTDFQDEFGNIHHAPMKNIKVENISIFSDRSSLEFFFNDGEMVMTEIIFPTAPLLKVELKGFKGENKVHYFKSIWNNQ